MVEAYSPTSLTRYLDKYLWDRYQIEGAEYRFSFVESTLVPTLYVYFESKIGGTKEPMATLTSYSEYNKISDEAKKQLDQQVGLLKVLGVI